MFSLKYSRISLCFRQKSNFLSKSDQTLNFSVYTKNHKTFSRFTNTIFASAAAIGLSLYIAKKKNAVNEAAITINNEKIFSVDHDYSEAIAECRDLLQRVKDEHGAPGIVIGVSIDDKEVWSEGLGYSDVENRLLCSPDTVLRIASISKSITMTAVAKLWEEGKLDLDKPIQEYVPYFPVKDFEGKPVTITCRQLVSHLGGIRHYEKSGNSLERKTEVSNDKYKKFDVSNSVMKYDSFGSKEYLNKEHYKDVKSSLDMFKDDPLIVNPEIMLKTKMDV